MHKVVLSVLYISGILTSLHYSPVCVCVCVCVQEEDDRGEHEADAGDGGRVQETEEGGEGGS